MNDALLMRVLDRVTNLREEFQPLVGGKIISRNNHERAKFPNPLGRAQRNPKFARPPPHVSGRQKNRA